MTTKILENVWHIVVLILFIDKCTGAAVRNEPLLFTQTPLAIQHKLNSTSSSLDELLTTFRYKRSGGFPKFPIQEKLLHRDTYYTAKECGTRVIHFDPLRKGKIVGGTSVSKAFLYELGFFYHI